MGFLPIRATTPGSEHRDAPRHGAGRRPMVSLALGVLSVTAGCQALVPAALPTRFGMGEDAKIAKQAKADAFPSPADVGLASSSADSELPSANGR